MENDQKGKYMKKFKKITLTATMFAFMLITPVLTVPKLPTIPNISGSVTLPEGAAESARKAGAEAAKNIKIDFSKINIG